ncbi:hypothetical protein HDV05_003520, partial [Chytridiales sp. JEL 0842]
PLPVRRRSSVLPTPISKSSNKSFFSKSRPKNESFSITETTPRTNSNPQTTDYPFEIQVDTLNRTSTSTTDDSTSDTTVSSASNTHPQTSTTPTHPPPAPDMRWLVLEVSDTGIGIPPQLSETLFQPYHQAHISTSREYGGTGLGLAICKQIVDLMQGSIRVESQVGRGSRFTVRIPVGIGTGSEGKDVEEKEMVGRDVSVATLKCDLGDDAKAEDNDLVGGDQSAGKVGANVLSPMVGGFGGLNEALADAATTTLVASQQLDAAVASFPTAPSQPAASLPADTIVVIPPSNTAVVISPPPTTNTHTTLVKPAPASFLSPQHEPFPHQVVDTKPPTSPFTHLKILVVDDSAINRSILVKLMRLLGVQTVVECANGQEAIDIVFSPEHCNSDGNTDFSMIFMDIQMPVLDGIEATTRLRRSGVQVPIIAVTGNHIADKSGFLQHGFDALAPKPFLKGDALKLLADYCM